MTAFTRTLCIITASLLAAPVHALDTNRKEVREFIDQMSREHGFKKTALRRLLRKAETKQAILDAISRPAERVVPWYEYRERFMTPRRIAKGAYFRGQHAAMLDKLATQGSPVAAILGILGVETQFGENTGHYRVIDALSTLAFDYPPRADFFRDELQQFLLLTKEQGIAADQAFGSYAGAMGPPQFMPSSYRKYAVDGDGDGKLDLWNDWDDVLASVSNYLLQFGWRSGEPVMAEASFDTDPATLNIIGSGRDIALNETVGSLKSKGVRFETSLPAEAPALLFVLQGKEGPLYRVGFNNFYVLTRYNRSTLYVSAAYELGTAIMNAGADAPE